MKLKEIPLLENGTGLICTKTEHPDVWTVGKMYMVIDGYIRNDVGHKYVLCHTYSDTEFEVQPKFIRSVMRNSREAQLGLFSLGYRWMCCGTNVQSLGKNCYLYTSEDGVLTWDFHKREGIPEDQYEFTTQVTAKLKPQLTKEQKRDS